MRPLFPDVSSCVCVSTVAGQEDCWLLTETLIQNVSLQLKVCLNVQCLALHSFTDLHPGKYHALQHPLRLRIHSSTDRFSFLLVHCPPACSQRWLYTFIHTKYLKNSC